MTAIGIYTSKTNIYLITFLISEDDIDDGGAENDENATFALLMHANDKALSFPFLSLSLMPFPGISDAISWHPSDFE